MTRIPIELNGGIMPTKGSKYAAAFDLYCPEDFELKEQRHVVPLGFCIALPIGFKANIRPRSGFSAKGMEVEVRTTWRHWDGDTYTASEKRRIDADVLLGLVDSDYRDTVGVIIKVYSLYGVAAQRDEFDTIVENHVFLTRGTRLAQMEVCPGECELIEVPEIDREIDRGGGFGHTGV